MGNQMTVCEPRFQGRAHSSCDLVSRQPGWICSPDEDSQGKRVKYYSGVSAGSFLQKGLLKGCVIGAELTDRVCDRNMGSS